MSKIFCATFMYCISVVAPLIAALYAGHIKATFYSRTNQVQFCYHLIVDTTADLVQLLRITAKNPSVNCPPEKRFASGTQVKILHTDSRLLVQFSPWERTCSGHSSGRCVRSKFTQKLSHKYHINSPFPGSSHSFSVS